MTQAADASLWGLGGESDPRHWTTAVPRTAHGPESRFVFRFDPSRGWVFPAGHIDRYILAPVPRHDRHAVGGIVLLDDDHVEVRFASCEAHGRRYARRRLEEWANMLGVRLDILPGTVRLRPFPGTHRAWECTRCGRRVDGPGARAMAWEPKKRWRDTRCGCGGHLLPVRRPAPVVVRRRRHEDGDR